ncbi:MAG: bifunctional phosphopantothenoylcysteine decarboxylase/phosphopantothenate--cysteine ligase CoaBC [Halanaerobiaceae bacterium]
MENKQIVLGITGGIAAYKMAEVASRLVKKDYNVHVVMTEAGAEFITPLTFRTITGNPVEIDLFSPPKQHNVKHISLADRADAVLVAPATADFLARMAGGFANNLLSSLILATGAPVAVAPSMNVNMYNNPAVQDNLTLLEERGIYIITPDSGLLACGYSGKGRLPQPEVLVEEVEYLVTGDDLEPKKILVTAGPTREPLDPVRYLSNYSSGKMGYALARAAVSRGARVKLISGPVNLRVPARVESEQVTTAKEMKTAVDTSAREQDIIIMAAAVADFRPEKREKEKIKKMGNDNRNLPLRANPDILASLGEKKKPGQVLVGFAAESSNLIENAKRKLQEKNLDFIAVNDITDDNSGFQSDYNRVILLTGKDKIEIPLSEKNEVAHEILDQIVERGSEQVTGSK